MRRSRSRRRARPPVAEKVEIGIAYGTEKQTWLEWAAKEIANTEEGRRIAVNLLPMGSIEGAKAVLDGDRRIHVSSPASRLYREQFERDWETRYTGRRSSRKKCSP